MAFPPPFPNPMMGRPPASQAPPLLGGGQKFGFFSNPASMPNFPIPMVGGIPITLRPPRHPYIRKPEPQVQTFVAPKPIPLTTVFVGNITDKCHDTVIQQILAECGGVSNWKRLQDPSGKFKAFGFCEFFNPDGARKALRILKNYPLGDKRLNLKVDDETEKSLEEFAVNKAKLAAINGQTVVDDDESIKEAIKNIIESQAPELLELKPAEEEEVVAKDVDKAKEEGKSPADGSKTPTKRKGSRSSSHSSRRRRSSSKGRHSRTKKSRRRSSSTFSGSSNSSGGGRSRKDKEKAKKVSARKRTPSSEDSDAVAEKRRLKRELKEREEGYMRRLKKWEDRERRMAKQYGKDEEAEQQRVKTIQKEAKKLRKFLEDYQDARDDPKFYKGSALFERRRNYEREREADAKDRQEERRELEEVKKLLLKDGKRQSSSRASSRQEDEARPKDGTWAAVDGEQTNGDGVEAVPAPATSTPSSTPQPAAPDTPLGDASPSPQKQQQQQQKVVTTLQQKTLQTPVNGVFEEDEEEEDTLHQIKKKIKPFEITREDRIHSLTPEERKKLIKELIARIPTDREQLFAFNISWEYLDEVLMEQRVRPWINKKIHDYIGEEEQSLVAFICEKIESQATPDAILQDLTMVLDDEAEVFIVKLWRLIVYESEAKRLGLNVLPSKLT